ncbi:hypothetical protein ADH70_014665 [Blautia pseudococcoides]|uniref:Uncharacterized protein n=1 Tax=Blautia pseudococcoides TaxID=1796616 RepID=A0A1C7IC47_9FIRM|nr:hypothetical protein A4V09_16135 [Blautia pseudococcoides]ASU29954.1 hypothetical protein ADH70_014665 [Blautia pseudococcoides]
MVYILHSSPGTYNAATKAPVLFVMKLWYKDCKRNNRFICRMESFPLKTAKNQALDARPCLVFP